MNKNEIFDSVKDILIECLESPVEITLKDKFENIPEWSSIIYIMVISAIEDKYGITLQVDELFDVEDVNGLVDLTLKSLL